MVKYAVIRLQGSQYKVNEKQEIFVDKIKDLKKINPEVLLYVDEKITKMSKKDKNLNIMLQKLESELQK